MNATVKRALDVVLSLLGLLLLSPLLLVVALAISLTSPGPPLFRQRRTGRGAQEFIMWKFRTMVADADTLRPALMAQSRNTGWLDLEHDPRVTTVGRVLRHTSIDELPQLINVLRGDMSLVGPRPLPLDEHERIPAWAWRRFDVRPGITGLWQVSGRMTIGFYDMLKIDCDYVREASVWTDLKILAKTVPVLLTAKGAD